MSIVTHHESMESTFQAAVAASVYAGAPIKFENAPFKQPETAWFAIHLIEGKSFLTNLARNKQIDRHVGIVQVDVLVPELTGARTAYSMAEWAGKLWRLVTVSLADGAVVRYRTPQITSHGTQGGFHRAIASVAYWRDEPAQ